MAYTCLDLASSGFRPDKPETFDATVEVALQSGVRFAQFLMMTPFPGTVDFARWEREQERNPTLVGDVPITPYGLIPSEIRPKMFTPHPSMSAARNCRTHTEGLGQVL